MISVAGPVTESAATAVDRVVSQEAESGALQAWADALGKANAEAAIAKRQ